MPRVAYTSLELDSTHALEVSLPEGALVHGRIRAAIDGAPIASASVRLFFPVSKNTVESTWSLGDTSFASTIQTAAEGRTDADGSFNVIVPVVAKNRFGMGPDGSPNAGPTMADFGMPALDLR